MKSDKLSNEHKGIIADVLGQVMDEYTTNNKIIFASESERAKHHFGTLSRQLKDWKKSRQCMVPGCPGQSINKSHAIPKAMSLVPISERGHLLTPEFDQQHGRMALKPVAVSLASAFPGFCSRHERLFQEFETQKKLDTEAHVYLQTYRAACRELFRSNFLIEQHESLIASYCRLRDEGLRTLVKQRAIDKGFPSDVKFTSLSCPKDPLVAWANDRISIVRELSFRIEDRILPCLERAVFNGCEDDIFVGALSTDLPIPVALSGCAAFFVDDHGVKKQVDLIMSVLPNAGHSRLVLAGDIADKDYIELYVSHWAVDVFSIVSMIECWMVNGTDQWYLKPSVWDKLSDRRKAAILDAIFQCDQNIGQEYELSIFDDIRATLLLMLKEKEEPTEDDAYWRFVGSQRAKMI